MTHIIYRNEKGFGVIKNGFFSEYVGHIDESTDFDDYLETGTEVRAIRNECEYADELEEALTYRNIEWIWTKKATP